MGKYENGRVVAHLGQLTEVFFGINGRRSAVLGEGVGVDINGGGKSLLNGVVNVSGVGKVGSVVFVRGTACCRACSTSIGL